MQMYRYTDKYIQIQRCRYEKGIQTDRGIYVQTGAYKCRHAGMQIDKTDRPAGTKINKQRWRQAGRRRDRQADVTRLVHAG